MNLCLKVRHDKVVLVPRTMKNGVVEIIRDKALAFIRINIEGNFFILE